MLDARALAQILPTLPRKTAHGPWSRAVPDELLQKPVPGGAPDSRPRPLWPGGAVLTGGRFNPRETFDTIYLAADSITASCEVGAAIFQPGGAPIAVEHMPLVFVSIRGTVSDLLDLREPDICDALHTSDIELTNDWRYWQSLHAMGVSSIPPTQELGRAAYMCGVIRGLVFPSSKNRPHGICLAIFPDRLADGDFLEVHDPSGRLVERYP